MKINILAYDKNQYKEGFTLIEVIVAVSIVVILASLAVPKVSGYIEKARNSKAVNAGKQIYSAAMWSYTDKGNSFVEDSVEEAIIALAGIKTTDLVTVACTNIVPTSGGTSTTTPNTNEVNITYKNDTVSYIMTINATTNVFTISKSGTAPPLFTSN